MGVSASHPTSKLRWSRRSREPQLPMGPLDTATMGSAEKCNSPAGENLDDLLAKHVHACEFAKGRWEHVADRKSRRSSLV